MPVAKLNFGPNQESGSSELAGASPIAMNVVVDAKGAVRRRPHVVPLGEIDFGGAITGVYISLTGELFVYVNLDGSPSNSVFRVASDGSSAVEISSAMALIGELRPTWAETEAMVVLTDGTDVLKWTHATSSLERMSGDPPAGSHVIANSLRLLINNLEDVLGQVNYSAISLGSSTGGNETWSGDYPGGGSAGSFVGEARPDSVVALHENTNEVFLFGKSSLQVYGPDNYYVYGPVATRESGVVAPYSVIKVDQVFAWLDHQRRFVIGDGRTSKVISDPIQETLDGMTAFSDCFGYRVATGAVDCLVWTFPTDGRTFCYQLGGGWSQWSGWDSVTGAWKRMSVESACMDPAGGRVVVGTTSGRLGTMEFSGVETDLDDPLTAYVETGFEDRGTDRLKHCVAFRASFRRGYGTSPESVLLSWRDQPGAWNAPIECELGSAGDTQPSLVFRSLGVYSRRQWRMQFSGSTTLILARAEEEFEILDQ